MRRSRRIYKRKSRSNLETLIILIGAIVILSVAFYMARERSFLPPEEIKTERQDIFEEEIVHRSEVSQKEIEGIVAPSGNDDEEQIEQEIAEKPAISHTQEEQPAQATEQSPRRESDIPETRVVPESVVQEQIRDEIAESITSGPVYTVQVGFFTVENNARSLAREIENQGFQTHVLRHNNAYKVQVGAYQNREQAERASRELKNLGYEIWVTQR